MSPILIILIAVIITGIIVALVLFSTRRYHRRFNALVQHLKATRKGWSCSGTVEDFDYTITFSPQDPNLLLKLHHSFDHSIKIVPENLTHRLGKRTGLVDEVQSGDEAFDQSFFLDGDNSQFVADFVANELRRRHIKGIFDTHPGIAELQIRPDGLQVTLFPCYLKQTEMEATVIRALLMRLVGICEAQQRSVSIPSTVYVPRTIEANRFTKMIIISAIANMALGLGLLLYGITAYRPMETLIFSHGLYGGIPLGLLAAGGIIAAFRGRPYALRSIGITSLLAIAGSIMLVMGSMLVYNGGADPKPAKEHIVTVLDKIKTKGKSPSFKLEISSWHTDRKSEIITVSQTEFAAVRNEGRMWIRVGNGALGYPWIHSYGVLGKRR